MRNTAGIYIFSPEGRLLVVHASEIRRDRWGIPKGRPDEGETSKMAAIREVFEETGIDLPQYRKYVQYIGDELYLNKPETLIAYTVELPVEIPIEDLYCESLFISLYSGDMIPEVDDYKWVYFEEFKDRIQTEQIRLWERYINGG